MTLSREATPREKGEAEMSVEENIQTAEEHLEAEAKREMDRLL
ncbi:MAG: hypothetical protein ACE5IQ_00780 [Candidatus Methylomirabilales bacterium]